MSAPEGQEGAQLITVDAAPETEPATVGLKSSFARSSFVYVAGATATKLTGVVKLSAMAWAIGVTETRIADTYNIANGIPNIIYDLVVGGILGSILIPLLVEVRERSSREAMNDSANALMTLTVIICLAATGVAIWFAPAVATLYSSRLPAGSTGQAEAMTLLLRLLIPQITLYGIAVVTAGLLEADSRFAAPSFAPALTNTAIIASFIAVGSYYDPTSIGTVPRSELVILGLGTTVGVALVPIAQIIALRNTWRFRPRLSLRREFTGRLLSLSGWGAGFVGVTALGFAAIQWIANAQRGGWSSYQAANSLFLIPYSLIGSAIISVLLPSLSQSAVRQDWGNFRRRLNSSIIATAAVMLPLTTLLWILAPPLSGLLIEIGASGRHSANLVAATLRILSLGLLPFSLFMLSTKAFLSLRDSRTPFLVNGALVALLVGGGIPLFQAWGIRGLALSYSAANALGALVIMYLLARRVEGLRFTHLGLATRRLFVATVCSGAACWVVTSLIASLSPLSQDIGRLLAVVTGTGAAGLAYWALLLRLDIPEIETLRGLARDVLVRNRA